MAVRMGRLRDPCAQLRGVLAITDPQHARGCVGGEEPLGGIGKREDALRRDHPSDISDHDLRVGDTQAASGAQTRGGGGSEALGVDRVVENGGALHAHSLAAIVFAMELRDQDETVGAPGEQIARARPLGRVVPMPEERHARAGDCADGEEHPVEPRIVGDRPFRPLSQRQVQQRHGDAYAAASPGAYRTPSSPAPREAAPPPGCRRSPDSARHGLAAPSRSPGPRCAARCRSRACWILRTAVSFARLYPMGNHRRHERHPLLRSRVRSAVRQRDAAAAGDGRHGSDGGACCRCPGGARRAAQPRRLRAAGICRRGAITAITQVIVNRDSRALPTVRELYPNARLHLWLHDRVRPRSKRARRIAADAGILRDLAVRVICVSDTQRQAVEAASALDESG